jgi:hypothetical protein
MKTIFKKAVILILFSVFLFTSCRTEETEFIQAPQEETLVANSTIATLMLRTATNDGSFDNIIDGSNCFDVQFPVTVIVNGIEVTVNSNDDLDDIEAIFDEFEQDNDILNIIFPITIIQSDFATVVINNITELNTYSANCNGENEIDDDIECIDFQYPITASIFNTNSELIDAVTITNDNDLYDFIEDLDMSTIVTIDFPIVVILSDGEQVTVNNLIELEVTIENAKDDCDEDDDNDFNDDDCNNCTDNQFIDILTGCTNWMVDKLERNDNDLEDIYVGYLFDFLNDGTLSVTSGSNSFSGTWDAMGSGNNITVTIDVIGLSDFNDSWNLHETEQTTGETKVDLRRGDDRLRFESDCIDDGGGSVDDTALVTALTTGDWYITFYFNDTNETTDFNDYVFNFSSDGIATATDTNGSTNGTWSTSSGDETPLELNLNFGTSTPLDELAEDWDVLEVTNDIIRLKDVSGGDGSEDFLTFERSLVGGGGNDLANILSGDSWVVGSYTDNGDDETADYNGYQINFDSNGTVVADNGTPINGTWAVQSSGNKLILDFGTSFPFDEFNDDWDVISVTATQVVLQDVSGGNGGTDILIFEKN